MNGTSLPSQRETARQETAVGVAGHDHGVHIARALRAALVNLHVYPRGHRIVQECIDTLFEHFSSLLNRREKITIELKEHGTLEINGVPLSKKGPEREIAAWVVRHFHDRAVKTVIFTPGLSKEELDHFLELFARDLNALIDTTIVEEMEKLGIEHIETKKHLLSEGGGRPVIVGIADGDAPEIEVNLSADSLIRLIRSSEFREAIERLPAPTFLFEQFQRYLVAFLKQLGLQVPKFVQRAGDPGIVFHGLQKLDSRLAGSKRASRLMKGAAVGEAPYEEATVTALHAMLRSVEEEGSSTLMQWATEGVTELAATMPPSTLARFLARPISKCADDTGETIQSRVVTTLARTKRRLAPLQKALIDMSERVESREEYAHLVEMLTRTAKTQLATGSAEDAKEAVQALKQIRRGAKARGMCKEVERAIRTIASDDLLQTLTARLRQKPDAVEHQEMLISLGVPALDILLRELRETPDVYYQNALIEIVSRICREEAAFTCSAKPLFPLMRQLREKKLPVPFLCHLLKIFARTGHPQVEASIIECAHHPHPQVEAEAIRALLSVSSRKGLLLLQEKIFHDRIKESADLRRAVNRLAEAALPRFSALVARLLASNIDMDIQMTAIQGLGKASEAEALPLLEQIVMKRRLVSRKPLQPLPLRLAAVRALGDLGGRGAEKLLTRLWDVESDPKMLDVIDLALSKIGANAAPA